MKYYSLILVLISSISLQGLAADNRKAGITCQIFSGNLATADSAQRSTSLIVKSQFLDKINEKIAISIPFKNLAGEARPMNLTVQRIDLKPFGNTRSSDSLHVGADYSLNNPFEADSVFARNDISGQTIVRGSRFVFEGETNALDAVNFLRTKTNYSIFNPYLILKLTPENKQDQLVTPSGQVTNYIVLSCVVSTPF